MSTELEKMFSADVLAAFDERVRRIMRETQCPAQPAPARDEELTVKQVAALKGVRPRTVYDWVAQKRIRFHHTPGGQLRFYRRHLDVITSAP
jgi:excisionase family DNA binding protein